LGPGCAPFFGGETVHGLVLPGAPDSTASSDAVSSPWWLLMERRIEKQGAEMRRAHNLWERPGEPEDGMMCSLLCVPLLLIYLPKPIGPHKIALAPSLMPLPGRPRWSRRPINRYSQGIFVDARFMTMSFVRSLDFSSPRNRTRIHRTSKLINITIDERGCSSAYRWIARPPCLTTKAINILKSLLMSTLATGGQSSFWRGSHCFGIDSDICNNIVT